MSNSLTNPISVYKKINHLGSKETIPFDIFLDNIRDGFWQDIVNKVRVIKDKKERDEMKQTAPSVTISGKFKERYDNNLEQHSGYIGIDIDEKGLKDGLSLEDHKSLICSDKHVVAAFTSISGRGLCLIFKIDPKKHREAFQGIGEYLYKNYGVIIDPTSINVSRARFVSFDPYIYVADKAEKFVQYPEQKPVKRVEKTVYAKDDFTMVLKQIVEKRLNLVESYQEWIAVGFAFASKFGEGGREYFHTVSQYSSKYDPAVCDKQYSILVARQGASSGKDINISTFYYYAKQAGLEIYSPKTRTIAYSAIQGKKGGLSAKQVAENLEKFEGITDAEEVIEQVMEGNIELNEDTLLDQLELWIRQNYSLERNEITRYIENAGTMLTQKDLNSIYIKAKKVLEKLPYDLVDRLINSDFVTTYNPFIRYFSKLEYTTPVNLAEGEHLTPLAIVHIIREHFPLVAKLFGCINTIDTDYTIYFGAKWLVGTISAVHGRHSPLMFVLTGDVQNTGKTEFFRRLLPKELHEENRSYPDYYAESKLDAGKDDEILMTQKLLIVDDEMGGKSKKEVKRLKELTSKQTFSLREPYGRNNVDLQRIAVLAGTTNDNELLSDPTGNRRIIPIQVYSIDNATYNSIDKQELWKQVYSLYQCGLRWRLDKTDIRYLNTNEELFEVTKSEAELLQRYYKPGGDTQLTATDIKVYIESKTNQRLSIDALGKSLKQLGFAQSHVKVNGSTKRVYHVTTLIDEDGFRPPGHADDDLPF